jgi:hypothetical protein
MKKVPIPAMNIAQSGPLLGKNITDIASYRILEPVKVTYCCKTEGEVYGVFPPDGSISMVIEVPPSRWLQAPFTESYAHDAYLIVGIEHVDGSRRLRVVHAEVLVQYSCAALCYVNTRLVPVENFSYLPPVVLSFPEHTISRAMISIMRSYPRNRLPSIACAQVFEMMWEPPDEHYNAEENPSVRRGLGG